MRSERQAKSSSPRQATPVDEAIGRQIRKRRRMLGISQLELANAVGVASQQIQKYEIGANRLSVSRLVEIAAALEAPVAWFFRGLAAADAEPSVPGKRSAAPSAAREATTLSMERSGAKRG